MTYKDNFNSKKFILATLIVLLNFVLMYFEIIEGGVYSTVVLATIASYLASNVIAGQQPDASVTKTVSTTVEKKSS